MVSKYWYKYINLILIITLAIVFFKGCHSFLAENIYFSNEYAKSPECRLIKHKLGESCIPINPQRIIVTDPENLEILVALGIKPIASARANAVGNKINILDEDKVDGIINLGKESQINFEKIIQLKPDLIIGFSYSSQDYKLLSQIAPTVYFDYTELGWKKTLLEVAGVLNKTKKAEKLLEEYQHRIESLKLKFAQKIEDTKISVMRFYTTIQFTQFLNELSFPVSILEELELSIPLAQRQVSRGANVSYNNVSLERVDLLESDAMFIALDPGAEENFQAYQNSPLWQTLNVVKNNRIYTVDSGYWIFGNILSANAILDDLVKYLIKGS